MNFSEFLNQCWKDHARAAEQVAGRIPEGFSLISESAELTQFANFITHLFGEHLGKITEGIAHIEKLMTSGLATPEIIASLKCSKVTLGYAAGAVTDWAGITSAEKVRIYAAAAGIRTSRSEIGQAEKDLHSALEIAQDLASTDSANRTLAVSANNLACALEEKVALAPDEEALMLLAAHAGRKYWQIAGTWLEVERAEYRLAQSYLKARDPISSIKHANLCLTICEANQAAPLEFFFAYEAIALVEHKMKQVTLRSLPQMQKYFAELSDSDKEWCRKTLLKVESLNGPGAN